MKKSLILTVGILISLVSCKEKVTEKQTISESKSSIDLKTETVKNIEEIDIYQKYVENDSLSSLLESELNRLALNPKFDLKTRTIINKHDKSIIDTIKTQTFDKTEINSYYGTNRESIYAAKIENSEFNFLDSIKIGIQKKTLEIQLKTELDLDIIKLGNSEKTTDFIFIFENDKLKTIYYHKYAD